MTQADVWQFPCSLQLKVVGDKRPAFADDVISAIARVLPGDYSARETPSSAGRYVSVTVTVHFINYEQVQAVYQQLRDVSGVKLVL